MSIFADEMGAFIHKYDNEMIDGLSAFYDPTPIPTGPQNQRPSYQDRIPQINMLCGCTPQNLTDLMPEKAWGQGLPRA